MPSVRYYNQTAPFWDFIANLEEQGNQHPFFGGNNNNNNNHERGEAGNEQTQDAEQQVPWAGFWPFGPMPHRGPHGPHGHHGPRGPHGRHGPPPPPPPPQAGQPEPPHPEHGNSPPPPPEYEGPSDGEPGPSEPRDRHHEHGHGHDRHRGHCGARGRSWGGRGRGGPCGGGRRGPAMNGAGGVPFPFAPLAEMFQSQLFGQNNNSTDREGNQQDDFKPEVDVFDTTEAYIVHASLPGAKKEDVGVNWDAEKSELSIAGVVYRPGDEDLLNTLALDERKVGAFERKVRLGSRAHPAQVDVDGITAKLEDGVLRIEVPKMDSGFVEIKKVDIE